MGNQQGEQIPEEYKNPQRARQYLVEELKLSPEAVDKVLKGKKKVKDFGVLLDQIEKARKKIEAKQPKRRNPSTPSEPNPLQPGSSSKPVASDSSDEPEIHGELPEGSIVAIGHQPGPISQQWLDSSSESSYERELGEKPELPEEEVSNDEPEHLDEAPPSDDDQVNLGGLEVALSDLYGQPPINPF